jgi:hypothetical protein
MKNYKKKRFYFQGNTVFDEVYLDVLHFDAANEVSIGSVKSLIIATLSSYFLFQEAVEGVV